MSTLRCFDSISLPSLPTRYFCEHVTIGFPLFPKAYRLLSTHASLRQSLVRLRYTLHVWRSLTHCLSSGYVLVQWSLIASRAVSELPGFR